MHFDDIDKRLFSYIQADFPLSREPFSALGSRLGISGGEVIDRIERFKKEGVVRQIGPVLEARRLGRYTTLVAMKVAEEGLDRAAEAIRRHPGISHGYQRDHDFNIWFTLSSPSAAVMRTELNKLAAAMEAEAAVELPVLKLYKIGFYLDMAGSGQPETKNAGTPYGKARLSRQDRALINELQQDLPLVDRPFDIMSTKLQMDVEGFLSRCRSLKRRGIMRRFGAAVNHRSAGYEANAMTCWVAPAEVVDAAGDRLASFKEVSHCYQRKGGPSWPYNLFAMIHGRSIQDCLKVADAVTQQCHLEKYVALFSIREFKKVRVKYVL